MVEGLEKISVKHFKALCTKMAKITASYNVIPNESTPKGCLWLSDSDQATRWSHTPSIYMYKTNCRNYHDSIKRMRDSLSKILVRYYPLAGRLRWLEGGRLELDCNAKGVKLLEAESTKTLAEYEDLDFSPESEAIKELIPTVDYTQPIEELPLLLVQVTSFPGGDDQEGLAIGVAFSHPLGDGLAAIRFINSWAKLSRGDTLDPDEMFPFLDRTVLKSPHPPLAPRFDHPELKPFPLLLGTSDSMAENKKKKTFALLKLTSEQVEELKKKANQEYDQSQKLGSRASRPHGRYEAIAAHIWRCASKARQLDEHQPTIVRVDADIRQRLNPPLPKNYFGNALAPTVTPVCHAGQIMSNPLGYAAQKMREAVGVLTDEYIRSQLDFIRGQKQMDWIRGSFMELDQEPKNNNPQFYGNPNLNIGSWMSMPVYDADFGWGKPVYFGPGAVNHDGRAVITLGPDGDGSLFVSMHLQVAHMQLFNKFFYEDL